MRFSTLLFLIISFSALSQERRLALVIGNSNYEKGPLQNPVNDALLMKETLEDLDFDVILDTNIATFSDFKNAIRLYGDSRDKYNVGFIYYAGHAVQINDVNYLLATKENYLSELDVEFNALSVQYIMRFLTSRTDEVNVLMLDACRDNPFEQNWNPKARSTEGGRGLAQIAPPTGSLVAYSTDAGNTAADGSGKNSIYCLSLIKNMVIENVTLDQVFRNVRADVLESSNGRQRPVEASQLTGDAFYLKKSTFTDQIIEIDSLIDVDNYALALEKTTRILVLSPQNKDALLRKGQIQYNTIGQQYDGADLFKARELYPKDPDVYIYTARYYYTIGNAENGISEIDRAIALDSTNSNAHYWKAIICYINLEQADKAMDAISAAIRFSPMNSEYYYYRGVILNDELKSFDQAINDYSKAIELNPRNVNYYYARGLLYDDHLNQDEKAIKDFEKVLEIDPADVNAINAIGLNYQEQGKPDLAIAQYEKGIALEKSNPFAAAFCFGNRAVIYADQGKLEEALKDYSKAIQLDLENGERYYNRANFFIDFLDDPSDALIDYSKAIELDPTDKDYYYARGLLHDDYFNQDEKAIKDFEKVLEIDPSDVDAINALGFIYEEQGRPDLAIAQFEKGIAFEKTNPLSAAFCYSNRALIYVDQGKLEEALKDYSKAIQLDPENGERYYYRANFFLDYLDELNNALIDYSKAIELSPKNVNYYYARGLLYDDYLKKDEKAIKDYEKILEIDSLDIQAINAIGLIYEENEKWDLAQKQYEKGILWEDVNPQAASFCYINRAGLFVKKDKYEDALLDYNKAIELDPFSGMKYYFRGDFFSVVKNDNNRALLDYSMAIHFEPNNLDFLHDRGLFYKKITEYEKAKEDLLKTLEIDSAFAMSFNSLGTIYQQEGDNEKALEYYQRGIESEGIDQNTIAFCYSNKGLIKSSLGQFEEAEIAYNGAILAEPENSEWYSDMALFHSTYSGKYQVSLTNINKAIKLDPNEASYYITRSYIHFLLNDKKTQLKDINRAIELEPDVPDWYCERGLYYEQNGEIEKAINEFNFGYALDSTYYNPLIHKAKTLMINNEFQEAINTLEMVIQIDPNDPEPYFLKGRIYENMHDTTKAIMNYSLSQGKLENYDYYISNNLGLEMNIGEYYVNLGDFYSKLGEKEIMCEYYNKASSSLADEYKFRCQELKKTLQEKLNQYCNY